jgi:hypothetical protein
MSQNNSPLALSVRQPWAWALVKGIKPLENRGEGLAHYARRLVGQHIGIHASKQYDDQDGIHAFQSILREPQVAAEIEKFHGPGPVTLRMMPLGSIVGVGRLARVVIGEDERLSGRELRWWAGPCGLIFDEVREIEPVPCKGRLGFWSMPEDVTALVRQRWVAAGAMRPNV